MISTQWAICQCQWKYSSWILTRQISSTWLKEFERPRSKCFFGATSRQNKQAVTLRREREDDRNLTALCNTRAVRFLDDSSFGIGSRGRLWTRASSSLEAAAKYLGCGFDFVLVGPGGTVTQRGVGATPTRVCVNSQKSQGEPTLCRQEQPFLSNWHVWFCSEKHEH